MRECCSCAVARHTLLLGEERVTRRETVWKSVVGSERGYEMGNEMGSEERVRESVERERGKGEGKARWVVLLVVLLTVLVKAPLIDRHRGQEEEEGEKREWERVGER